MIKLLNGRGQIGSQLKKHFKNESSKNNIYLYHTWNIENKDRISQKKEYDKFVSFLETIDKSDKVLFISTKSETNNWYVHYKNLAESFLICNFENCLVLRFPTLVGKGILHDLKSEKANPFGIMELMSIDEAVKIIIENTKHNGLQKILSFKGEEVSAQLVQKILQI